jgi:general stress protein 26
MSSINQQQPEKNHEDLQGKEGLKKIKEIAEKADVCFFCTNMSTGKAFSTRPMSVQEVDEEGIWFLSASDSQMNNEIMNDASVQLLFQGSDYSDFLNIHGTASVSKDQQKIKEFWKPLFKTWFTEGINDPRITVVNVKPDKGYYWDTKHNMVIGLLKRAAGAVLGKTLDDSIEGKIKV